MARSGGRPTKVDPTPFRRVLNPHARHQAQIDIIGNHVEISGGFGDGVEDMIFLDAQQAMEFAEYIISKRKHLDEHTSYR